MPARSARSHARPRARARAAVSRRKAAATPVPYDVALEGSRALARAFRAADVVHGTRGTAVVVAGSLRRKQATVADLDVLLVDRTDAQWAKLAAVRHLVLDRWGPKKAAGRFTFSWHRTRVTLNVDLRRVATRSLGAALEYFTGPKGHNLGMRLKAKRLGYKLNEYGLFRLADGVRVAGRTEQELYQVLGHPWKPPELRGR